MTAQGSHSAGIAPHRAVAFLRAVKVAQAAHCQQRYGMDSAGCSNPSHPVPPHSAENGVRCAGGNRGWYRAVFSCFVGFAPAFCGVAGFIYRVANAQAFRPSRLLFSVLFALTRKNRPRSAWDNLPNFLWTVFTATVSTHLLAMNIRFGNFLRWAGLCNAGRAPGYRLVHDGTHDVVPYASGSISRKT